MIDETLEDVKQRFGNVTYPEITEAGCNLYGEISKVGETEHKGSYIILESDQKRAEEIYWSEKRRCC